MPNMQELLKEGLIDFNLKILFLSSYDTFLLLFMYIEINEI